MKKYLSALLCVLFVLSLPLTLVGCGQSDQEKIIGSWRYELDLVKELSESFEELGDYLEVGSFVLNLNMEFSEDGTYTITIEDSALENALDGFTDSLIDAMSNYLMDYFEEQTGTRYSIDDILELSGTSLEDLVAELEEELSSQVQESASEMTVSGNYKIEDGKLYTSDSLETEIDETVYETYTLEGDTLTITGSVGGEEDTDYPIVLTKIS